MTREVSTANLIRAWEIGRVRVGESWLSGNLIISADAIFEDWRVGHPSELTLGDLEPALGLEPEIIVLGTGTGSHTPDVELMAALAARGIGLEIMSTPAACRTYNVLVHELRPVVAALFTSELSHPPGSSG